MVIGYTTGVFDMFHIGHLNILRRAKEQCDYLVVGVSTDELVQRDKNKMPIISFEERYAVVEAIRYVDQVIPQTDKNKYAAWERIHFNKMFVGSDWKGTDAWNCFEEQFEPVGVEIVYLDHTDGISSTILRDKLNSVDGKNNVEYQPLVTIIIPVYNGSNFMREAIDCALTQTYPNVEILVVNDGSTDNGETDKLARSYGDKIRYYLKENGGVSTVLNFAFEKMQGEWFSWLSHDDLYYPMKIEKQIAFIKRLLDTEKDIDLKKTAIHCATESIDKGGKVIKTPSYKGIPEKENARDVIIGNVYRYRLSGCSFLLPAACVADVGGFREDMRTVSDVEYWYRLLFHGYQFYCMPNDILVKNRSHGKQVGKTKVSLFERELNELHVHIADSIAADQKLNTPANMEAYYLGLVKRGMSAAAKYTKSTYLLPTMSSFQEKVVLPAKFIKWTVMGLARETAKRVYRKMLVR